MPRAVRHRLESGGKWKLPETRQSLLGNVENLIIGSNRLVARRGGTKGSPTLGYQDR